MSDYKNHLDVERMADENLNEQLSDTDTIEGVSPAERIAALEQENKELREALEQYADEKNWWDTDRSIYDYVWAGKGNGYDIARAALAAGK